MEPSPRQKPFDREIDEEYEGIAPFGKVLTKEMAVLAQQWHEAKSYWRSPYQVGRRDKQQCQAKQWLSLIHI